MPLPFEDADVVIGDLPIGYYPVDDRSKEMALGFDEGHSYSHFLLIEQAITAMKASGYAFLVVPSNIFEGENVKQLQNFIATETEMQAFLNLPSTLFKNEKARKSILVLQKKRNECDETSRSFISKYTRFQEPTTVPSIFTRFKCMDARKSS